MGAHAALNVMSKEAPAEVKPKGCAIEGPVWPWALHENLCKRPLGMWGSTEMYATVLRTLSLMPCNALPRDVCMSDFNVKCNIEVIPWAVSQRETSSKMQLVRNAVNSKNPIQV